MARTAYDEQDYPYTVRPFTHPARMASVAALHAREAAPFHRCRVLEVGGGDGINVVSMALAAPQSEFVNFDLAESTIEQGRRLIAAAGLRNVRQEVANLMDIPDSWGEFDYIIAHGVYAWTPAPVREGLMRLIGRLLSPRGVAMVSYNALPGCHIRQAARDIAWRAAQGKATPQARIAAARAALEFHVSRWDAEKPRQRAMREEAQRVLRQPDGVLFHDELCDEWNPQYLSDTAASARAHGLDYLGDMQQSAIADALFPGALYEETLAMTGGDFAAYEQIRDFAEGRLFRETLLCRAGAPIKRGFDAARLDGLYVDGLLEVEADSTGAAAFRLPNGGRISTQDSAFAQTLRRIAEAWPQALSIADLAVDADTREALARLFVNGALGLSSAPFACVREPGERPRAGMLARMQAAVGARDVSTLRHTTLRIDDETSRRFLGLLDGTRTLEELAVAMAGPGGDMIAAAASVQSALGAFVRSALIEA
jgi:SAM-dependent methyltransferase